MAFQYNLPFLWPWRPSEIWALLPTVISLCISTSVLHYASRPQVSFIPSNTPSPFPHKRPWASTFCPECHSPQMFFLLIPPSYPGLCANVTFSECLPLFISSKLTLSSCLPLRLYHIALLSVLYNSLYQITYLNDIFVYLLCVCYTPFNTP